MIALDLGVLRWMLNALSRMFQGILARLLIKRPVMPYCENLCLEMPASFPCLEYTLWRTTASPIVAAAPPGDPSWENLAASNLTAWRFRQSCEAWEHIKQLVHDKPNGGSHEDQYQMDSHMFTMLTTMISCIESTLYSISAVASSPMVVGYLFDNQAQRKGSDASWLLSQLTGHPKATLLVGELTLLVGSTDWKFLLDLRNRVSHRTNLSRIVFATVGGVLPPSVPFHYAATTNTPEIKRSVMDFESYHAWFAGTVRRLLVGACALL